MCDCIKVAESRCKDSFVKTIQGNETFKKVTFGGATFIFEKEGKVSQSTFSCVKVEYDRKAKSGNVQTKTKEFNLVHTYCPFCGEKRVFE